LYDADLQDNANVLTFRLKNGLEQAATFGLHEAVARMRPGALASTAPDVFRPDLLFATVSGRIGMLGELGLGAARTLGDLQRNMNGSVPGPGGLDWRS
jgi:DNA damage-binding protein 1